MSEYAVEVLADEYGTVAKTSVSEEYQMEVAIGEQSSVLVNTVPTDVLEVSLGEVVTTGSISDISALEVNVGGIPGPPGEQGIPGVSGLAARTLEQTFATPAKVWTIDHNWNTYFLDVATFELDGISEKAGSISYPSPNAVQIDWYWSESGIARLRG